MKTAASLERAWAKWPRSFPTFIQWLDRKKIPYLSHSRVADYVRCPACYYRRYILGEKSESQAMLLGTLFHKAAASLYKAKAANRQIRISVAADPASEKRESALGRLRLLVLPAPVVLK